MFSYLQWKQRNSKGQISIHISGTIFVALALFAVLALATGVSFNEIKSGSGVILISLGALSLLVLLIIALYELT